MIHVDEQSLRAAIEPEVGVGQESFYREALAAAGVGTWRLDMSSGLATWDEVTSRLFGYPVATREAPALLPIHPDDRDAAAAAVECSFTTGTSCRVEFRALLASGEIRWMRGMASPRTSEAGQRRWLCGIVFDIHDQKVSELALQDSQRQLSTLIDNLPGFAYRCRTAPPWRLEHASDGALEVTGYPARAWLSGEIAWAEIVHPDDLPRLMAEIAEGVAARRRFDVTYRVRHRDGSTRWLHERGQGIFDGNGQQLCVEGFVGDVTDQKLAEESLTAVLSGTLDCVYSLDRDYRFTYMNARAVRHYGGRNLIGQSIADIVPGAARSAFGDCYARVLRTGEAETIEAYLPPMDGWFEAHVTPTAQGITVFYRDISARKQAEEALRQAKERAYSMLDSVPQIVWTCTADGRCDYLSPQWRAFTARDPQADLGNAWTAAVHEEDRDRAHHAWHRSLADSLSYEVEFRLAHRDGGHRWVLARALPERDEGGRVVRWYGTCTDIDDGVLAKRALGESEALNRSILDSSPDCIKLIDRDSRILFVNRLGPRGMDVENNAQLIGTRWLDMLDAANAPEAEQAIKRAAAGETAHFTMMQPTVKGTAKWWDVLATPVEASGGAERLVVISRDVTHQKQSEERVRWIANHDSLTGLPNRLLFQERLDEITAGGEGGGHGFALLLLDMDAIRRQGELARQLKDVRRRHALRDAEPHVDARHGPPGAARRPHRSLLPAKDRSRLRRGLGLRSAAALAPLQPGHPDTRLHCGGV
jgi:PAS domain S-box-containing protein